MKQLALQTKQELTGSDLLAAILASSEPEQVVTELLSMQDVLKGYVKKHQKDVSKAVTTWLADQHQLKADKVIYQGERVIVEAHAFNGVAVKVAEPKKPRVRKAPEGHTKSNKGVFDFLREYFADEVKKQNTELKFEAVLKDAQFFYPKLTSRLLQIYLHDKRQLKNVDFSAKRGTVILK